MHLPHTQKCYNFYYWMEYNNVKNIYSIFSVLMIMISRTRLMSSYGALSHSFCLSQIWINILNIIKRDIYVTHSNAECDWILLDIVTTHLLKILKFRIEWHCSNVILNPWSQIRIKKEISLYFVFCCFKHKIGKIKPPGLFVLTA